METWNFFYFSNSSKILCYQTNKSFSLYQKYESINKTKKRLHFLIFQESMGFQQNKTKQHNHLNNLEIILITDYLFIV